MDSSNTYVYSRIPKLMFGRMRLKNGPFGHSVNQSVQELVDIAQSFSTDWIVRVKPVAASDNHETVGVKVRDYQMEWLKDIQSNWRDVDVNVSISDILHGLYLEAISQQETDESIAQLIDRVYPKFKHLIEVYIWKEVEGLVKVFG